MDGNQFFGFSKPKPGPGDHQADPAENQPLGIGSGEWEHAGENPKPPRQGGEFPILPPGVHTVIAGKAWTRQTASGNESLVIRWVCPEGPHRGASLLENLALGHPKGRPIAVAKLKAICVAAGMRGVPTRPSDLHGAVLRVVVGLRPDFRDQSKQVPAVEKHLPAGAV